MKFTESKKSLKICHEKCADYKTTKNKLMVILNRFFDEIEHKIICNTYSYGQQAYGAELRIFINDFLIVEQYGKGLTKSAAIASAYGEVIERMQLLYALFSHNPFKPTLSFPFLNRSRVPDNYLYLDKKFDYQIKKNNPYLFEWENSRNKWIEVLDIFEKKKAFLGYRFLYNPSGTAAGNSYSEALIQGLCEIFERYCVGKILLNQRKCPSIPLEQFNSKNQRLLRILENDGIKIYVKDFSLNKGFPTIGLLCDIEEKRVMVPEFIKQKRYHLQAGSATSMDIALEKTLAELFQVMGRVKNLSNEEEAHKSRINKIYDTFPILNNLIPENAFHCLMFVKKAFISDDYLRILLDDVGTFRSWSYYDKFDCSMEVRNLFKFLKMKGYHLYVMDYSWLFHTLLIIVPELHFGYNEILYESNEIIEFKKKLIFNFDKISKSDLKILEKERNILNIVLNPTLDKYLSIEVNKFKSISTWLFLGLLAKSFGLKDIAKKYFSQMIPFEFNQLNIAIRLNDPVYIKKYLFELLPSCQKSCEFCKYKKECKFYITKDLQQKVAESFPNYFKLRRKY